MRKNSGEKLDSMRIVNDSSEYLSSMLKGRSLEEIRRVLDEVRQATIQKYLMAEAQEESLLIAEGSVEKGNDLPFDVVAFRNFPKGVGDKKITCPTRPGQISDKCPVGCPRESDCIENQTR